MSALTYKCPKTSRTVKTAIVTEPAILARMRDTVACPHCTEGHSIPANEMYFEGLPWPAAALSHLEFLTCSSRLFRLLKFNRSHAC
jgi:hypothetical protein